MTKALRIAVIALIMTGLTLAIVMALYWSEYQAYRKTVKANEWFQSLEHDDVHWLYTRLGPEIFERDGIRPTYPQLQSFYKRIAESCATVRVRLDQPESREDLADPSRVPDAYVAFHERYWKNRAFSFAWLANQANNASLRSELGELPKKELLDAADYDLENPGNPNQGTVYNLWVETYEDAVAYLAASLKAKLYIGAAYAREQDRIFRALCGLNLPDVFVSGLTQDIGSEAIEKHKESLQSHEAVVKYASSCKVVLHKNYSPEDAAACDKTAIEILTEKRGVGKFDFAALVFRPTAECMFREFKAFLQAKPGTKIVLVCRKGHYWPQYFTADFNPRVYSRRMTSATPFVIAPERPVFVEMKPKAD